MSSRLIDRLVAGAVFAFALVLYTLTVAPTTSFWDAGEFIASVHDLQVMHPPGAPFYMLVGRLASMFAPPDLVALAVNMVSVLASALTVLLTHLVVVRLVQQWQGRPETWTAPERVVALTSGAVGALTFAVSDTFWFNAVEAEVYALSMLFTAAVVWLVMRWEDLARREEATLRGDQHPFTLRANRYLVLIAYLFGLAIGVHLLNLLAFFFIALIFFFIEFDRARWSARERWTGIAMTGAVSAVIFFAIYPGVVVQLPALAEASGAPFFTLAALAVAVGGFLYWTHATRRPALNLVAACLGMILVGYSSYALIFIRSAAEPPIDLNDPDTAEEFISYLKREQYGSTPLLSGVTYDPAKKEVPPAYVYDRAGRAQANEAAYTLFPRRYSPVQAHWRVYDRYDSDLDFFLSYQVSHMYTRYFLWNFAGRSSDVQDAPAMTGLPFLDPQVPALGDSPSEQASRNLYFALPLLLGLFGAFFHFTQDWRRAFSVGILFLVTGLGIIVYLNQTPMQPRERDYAYVGSFFAFSLWVGLGAGGLVQLAYDGLRDRLAPRALVLAMLGVAALTLAAVPGRMLSENYDDHDRSGNYVARDYAHNLLESLAPNAILFTNGDNDTYPLWYLQDVEGVRPDVRVVNLSLLNTPWYIKQIKHEPAYEAAPVPLSYSDEAIDKLGARRWEPDVVTLPVSARLSERASEVFTPTADTSRIERPMRWRLRGQPIGRGYMLGVADQVVYNILRTNAEADWARPVYFAITVGQSGQLDLQDYFQLEGQAYRVVPIRHQVQLGRVVPGLSDERLERFAFTNLDDPSLYLNENARNMLSAYRTVFSHTALELADRGYLDRSEATLNRLVDEVPFTTVPGSLTDFLQLATAYEIVGNFERMADMMRRAEPGILAQIYYARDEEELALALRYAGLVRVAYRNADAADRLRAFDADLDRTLADIGYDDLPDDIRRAYGLALRADSAATAPALPPPVGTLPDSTALTPPAPSTDGAPPAPSPGGDTGE